MVTFCRRLTLTFLLLTLASIQASAAYVFLGKVETTEHIPSGLLLTCEGNNQVRIEFQLPHMYRVTLSRNEYSEPLLTYPLAKTEWPAVRIDYAETGSEYLLKTSALDLSISKSPCRLTVRDKQGKIINQDDPGMGIGWEGQEVRCWKKISPDEKFFGLGEKTGGVDKRGSEWTMWNTDFPAYTDRTDPLYESIPFYIGLRGGDAYGIYFNNSYRSTFNMGAGNQRYSSFSAVQGSLDYFFIYGPQIPTVVETYTELTGRMPMPPLWSLGYQQCRWSYYPASEVLRLAHTFRDKQIPADVIYLDIHYMDGYRVFTFDKERFPDPQGLMKELASMGFKVVVITDPGVKADTSAYVVAKEGLDQGHFVRYPDGELYVGEVWPGKSYFPDFSNDGTRIWWGKHISDFHKLGVSGFWNDMNEPACWGQAFPLEVYFHDGAPTSNFIATQKKIHNLYGLLMCKADFEGLQKDSPSERPFLVTRAGFAGIQRYSAVWTGDNVASWDHLELGIRMLQGLGLSGVPFVGTDVGGFMETPTPELMARWIQVGALSPFFRSHSAYGKKDQEPWAFGEDIENINRKFIAFRYQLLPYLYSGFHTAAETGDPIMRPLFWNDQRDEKAYYWEFRHQFFVGDRLLAAPVTKPGQTTQKVYLPAGKWLNFNTEAVYDGSGTVYVDAPLDQLPLFLREGAILPLRDSEQFVGEKPLINLRVEIFAGAEPSTFDFYEDDGLTTDYQKGSFRLSQFECKRKDNELRFAKHRTHDQFAIPDRTLELRFHAVEKKPKKITLDSAELGGKSVSYDATLKILTVWIVDKGQDQTITVQ